MAEQPMKICGNLELINPKMPPAIKFLHTARWRVSQTFSNLANEGIFPTLAKILNKVQVKNAKPQGNTRAAIVEVLNLQCGDLVEVKSEQEIRDSLDRNGRNKGLFFMAEMWKYCGKRFTVRKRINTIMVESTQAVKKVRNTVILDEVNCDGSGHEGCDCSCYHFWREAWLRKVEKS